MSLTSQIEEKLGLNIENLNAQEKQTYLNMLTDVEQSIMTPEKLRDYIISMKTAVETELINEPEFIRVFIFKVENRKQILLKARLQNYMLLESFLTSPERARDQLDNVIQGLVRKG